MNKKYMLCKEDVVKECIEGYNRRIDYEESKLLCLCDKRYMENVENRCDFEPYGEWKYCNPVLEQHITEQAVVVGKLEKERDELQAYLAGKITDKEMSPVVKRGIYVRKREQREERAWLKRLVEKTAEELAGISMMWLKGSCPDAEKMKESVWCDFWIDIRWACQECGFSMKIMENAEECVKERSEQFFTDMMEEEKRRFLANIRKMGDILMQKQAW